MDLRRLLLKITVLMMVTAFASADHKPGHAPKEGSGCYSGGPGNKAGQEDCPLTVVNLNDLQFPAVISGYSQIITVLPSDMGAAVFSIQGVPCSNVRVSVVENVDVMLANGHSTGDTIPTRDFTYGGSVDSTGAGIIGCNSGELTNIRVGGTAEVGASNSESSYQGILTLRALYY